MKKVTMFACVAMTLVFAVGSMAGDLPNLHSGNNDVIIGGNANFAKAAGDTIELMGPLGIYQGDFEDAAKSKYPLPAGWGSVDNSEPTTSRWNVSTTNNTQPGMTLNTAWCGAEIDACNTGDDPWGYGNNWLEYLDFRYELPTPLPNSVTVNLTYNIFWDSEPGYDYTTLKKVVQDADPVELMSYDDTGSVVGEVASTSFDDTEYVDGTAVVVRFEFDSDGGWSDDDCSWPTSGAVNLDEVFVEVKDGTTVLYSNTSNFDDGTFGDWALNYPPGCGDFAAVWDGLEDYDPCASNYSKVVAFLDDGTVTGTTPYPCDSWCYGPNGYVVHPEGGIAGPLFHIDNYIETPVMTWPNQAYDGITLEFDNYSHEALDDTSPGMFFVWGVRSATALQTIADQPYLDRNFVYYGNANWGRRSYAVTDLMEAGRTEVQCMVGAYELGYAWGYVGTDATPAPYFDNIHVIVYPVIGPGIAAREIDMINDNFFEVGSFDPGNLPRHHVRFDMAGNIALPATERNDPGDSMVMDITPLRAGSELFGMPTINYTVKKNPLFTDAMRPNMPTGAGVVSGSVDGWNAIVGGSPSETRFAFDLPDSGFLFPGDVLHYYIEAQDAVLGADIQTATLPSDLTGYGDFSHPLAYNTTFVIHALPSVQSDGLGGTEQPPVLFWNDFANRGAEQEWYGAFDNMGYVEGVDYDIYYTNGPSSGVGNGLGGRTGELGIENYTDMFYSSGNLGAYTLCNSDYEKDPSKDIEVMISWLNQGGKDLFMTGDGIVSDLSNVNSTLGNDFVELYMGVSYVDDDIRDNINNQATPVVEAVAGNGVFANATTWVAYGGCPGINTLDAVEAGSGASRLAEFLTPGGLPNYDFSAATLFTTGTGSRVVSLPYDFSYVYTVEGSKVDAPLSTRATMLQDVVSFFNLTTNPGGVSGVPGAVKFAARNYPNPFNPTTKIEYTVPKAGHLTLTIFNVRGEKVRTLIDGTVPGSGHIMWDGTSDSGSSVSSGVYFYEARFGQDVQVNKMTLVK